MKNKKTAGNQGNSAEDYLDESKHFNGFNAKPGDLLKGFIFRWIIFALIWWGLSMGKISQPFLIIFVITISAALSSLLIPPQNMRVTGIIRFTPFFIRLSVLGGLDVASRAFRPSMPLNTGFMNYNLKLANSTARVIFVWVVSLLPGTASVQLVGQILRIHVLDQELSHKQRLRELEKHVAALFKS